MSSTADAINANNPQASGSANVDRAAKKTHDTVDKVAESAAKAEQKIRDGAAQAEAKLHEVSAAAREAAQQNFDQVQGYVQRNPMKSAGIAFAAGVVLSAILRR